MRKKGKRTKDGEILDPESHCDFVVGGVLVCRQKGQSGYEGAHRARPVLVISRLATTRILG